VLRDGEIGHLVDLEAVGVGDIDFLLSSQHGERLEICGKEDDDDEGTGGESERWESSVHAICGGAAGCGCGGGEWRVGCERGDWRGIWRIGAWIRGAMILGRVPEHDAAMVSQRTRTRCASGPGFRCEREQGLAMWVGDTWTGYRHVGGGGCPRS
jgi:hypothetical protein